MLARVFENKFTRPIKRAFVRLVAVRRGSRKILNKYYGLLGDDSRARFYARYSKIFRDQKIRLANGTWNVRFANRTIILPLRLAWSWLDWDCAVSLIGHDIEIKQTYAALIDSNQRPALFLDVGANYGIHSILFLSAGIPVIAFEPNPDCLSYFQTACDLNGLSGHWEQVAIGNRTSEIELVYPEKESWLGSICPEVISGLKSSKGIIVRKVQLRTLDEYLRGIPREKVLMKIDVEGAEKEVLQGASELLKHCRPTIIFESNEAKTRDELFRQFERFEYSVHPLPWRPSVVSRLLGVDEFKASTATNFIAIASNN